MQVRIGKTRRHRGLRWIAGSAYASILAISLTFTSCSLFQSQDKLELKKAFQSLCLTSSGRGRIEYSQGRHVFSYESLWKPQENNWSMAFSLPVIGQELLSLTLRETDPLRLQVTGTFARRLKNDIKSKGQQQLLQSFYGAIGRFLLVVKNPDAENLQKRWKFKSLKGELQGEYVVSEDLTFTMRAFDLSEKFGRMNFVLRGSQKLSLDLFVSQCSL